jgi:hypothetical protein
MAVKIAALGALKRGLLDEFPKLVSNFKGARMIFQRTLRMIFSST